MLSQVLWVAIALAMSSITARADDVHHAAPPLGDRAIGLAGAFTAVADDPSASFYNPAGLVDDDTAGFAGGLTLIEIERFTIEDGFVDTRGDSDLKFRSRGFLPAFASTKIAFGEDSNGRNRVALAYSVFSLRSARVFDILLRGGTIDASITDSVRIEQNNREVFHGLSAAYRINKDWSIGGTLYLRIKSLGHAESQLLSRGGVRDDSTGLFQEADSLVRLSRLSARLFDLVPRFGVLYRRANRWSFGLATQLPAFRLRARGSAREQIVQSMQSMGPDQGNTDFAFVEDRSATIRDPVPLSFSLGAAWRRKGRVLYSADASVFAPVSGGERVAIDTESDGSTPVLGLYFDNETRREWVGNLAFGAERVLSDIVTVRGGLFTDFSSAPRIPSRPDAYQVEKIHRFGLSASFGFRFAGLSLNVGSAARFGWGRAVGVDGFTVDTSPQYVRRQARQRVFVFTISGAAAAARAVSRYATGETEVAGDPEAADAPNEQEGETE